MKILQSNRYNTLVANRIYKKLAAPDPNLNPQETSSLDPFDQTTGQWEPTSPVNNQMPQQIPNDEPEAPGEDATFAFSYTDFRGQTRDDEREYAAEQLDGLFESYKDMLKDGTITSVSFSRM